MHQRTHANHKAKRDRHQHGGSEPDGDTPDRIGQLNTNTLVVRARVVKRVRDVPNEFIKDGAWRREGRLALCLRPKKGRKLGVHRTRISCRAFDGELPCENRCTEQGQRKDGSPDGQWERARHGHTLPMEKDAAYSSAFAGSNSLPMMVYFS